MDILGQGIIRFNKVGDKLYWNTSVQISAKSGKTWLSIPTTLQKDVEEKVKKEFKSRKWTSDDKYIKINITKGFISGYLDKDNKKVLKLVITELEFVTDTKKKVETDDVEIPF